MYGYSCINAIRRFISRRGSVKEITSDNGTNLVGANNEMLKAVKELGEQDIHNFAVNHGIKWKFNTPRCFASWWCLGAPNKNREENTTSIASRAAR